MAVILLLSLGNVAQAQLIPYATLPNTTPSSEYSLSVDGVPVVVEKFRDLSYARFAFTGTVSVQVGTSAPIGTITISPTAYAITPNVSGSGFSFSLSQPRKLIVQISGREKLFIFADGAELDAPASSGPGIVNLTSYLSPGRDPAAPVTAQFQTAINDTAALNGGTGGVLYVPSGLYMSTQLQLRSNVQLYLESGALVQAINAFNASNYPLQNGSDSSFIYLRNVNNVTISGRGVIDDNGYAIRSSNPGGGNLKAIRTAGATNVSLRDFMIRDSARWTVHFLYSDYALASNLKIVNDVRLASDGGTPLVSNTDGFDLDASTYVTVKDCFVHTQDDAFSPKVSGYIELYKPTHDLTIRGNVISTRKAALKVGAEGGRDISAVIFDNNEIVYADRVLAIDNPDGHTMSGIAVTNNRAETIGVNNIPAFFDIDIEETPGFVSGVTVDGLYARNAPPGASAFKGYDAAHLIQDFSITNMYVGGLAVGSLNDIPVYLVNSFYRNLSASAPGSSGPPTVEVIASDPQAIQNQDSGVFTFSRAGPIEAPLIVNFSLGGSATSGVDYQALPGSIAIPAGANQANLAVIPYKGAASGATRSVDLQLLPDAGYRLGSSAADSVVIFGSSASAPDLPEVTLAATDASASEAPGDPGTFTVTRSGSAASALTVSYSISGNASNGTDYASLGSAVTIPVGANSTAITISPLQDAVVDDGETVSLALAASPAYSIGTPSADTVTIADAPPQVPVLTLAATGASASEAPGNNGVFTITRSGSTGSSLGVALSVGGTATNGVDDDPIPTSVVIPAGSASVNVAVVPHADNVIENTETVVLTVAAGAGYVVAPPASATVSIADVPPIPSIRVAVTDGSASEAAGNPGQFVLSRSGDLSVAVSVNLSLNGTATNGVDYTSIPASATFPAGSATVAVNVAPLPDSLTEGSETVVLAVAGGTGYTVGSPASGTVTILDVPPAKPKVSIAATDASASEAPGDPGLFTVTRSGADNSTALTVNFGVSGTATNGVDYSSLPSTLTIPAGAAAATLQVLPIPDNLAESTETVVLTLASDPGYQLGSPSSATVRIADATQTVSISVPDASASESGDGGLFSVNRSGSTAAALTVNLSIGGTATNGVDYNSIGSTVTIPAGAASATIAVSPIADSIAESTETVVLTVASGSAYVLGSATSGTVNIANVSTTTVSVAASDAAASETGDPGAFTLSRSGSTAAALAVNFSIGGSATNGVDYSSLGSTVNIPAGAASVAITVAPVADTLVEGPETVVLILAAGTGYAPGSPASATVTIADATLPTVSLTVPDASASESGDGGLFTVTRNGPTPSALTVSLAISGSATNGGDYGAIGNSVTIPAGAASASIAVSPIADSLTEGTETVVLSLTGGSGYQLGASSSGTVSIADASLPAVSLVASDASASESGDPGTFTITRTGDTGAALVVGLTIGGSASPGIDYQNIASTVTIPAGATAASVQITPLPDNLVEGNETVTLALAAGSGYLLAPASSAVVTIADTTVLPTVSLGVADASASEAGDGGLFTVSRDGPTTSALTVGVSVGGTATNGSDYTAIGNSVTIPAGAASFSIAVAPIADSLTEGTETVVLSLAGGSGYQLGAASSGTVSIADAAASSLPVVALVVQDGSASEAAGNPGAFSISRSGAKTAALTVQYSIGGTATNGVDYSAIASSATIPAGAASVVIVIQPLPDNLAEGSETVVLSLLADPGYALGSGTSGTVSIIDVPPPTITVVVNDSKASETGDTGQFTIKRSGATTAPLTVNFSLGGSATPGLDFTDVGSAVTIPAGSPLATVTIAPLSDALIEGTESVTLSVTADPVYLLGSAVSGTVSIADVPP